MNFATGNRVTVAGERGTIVYTFHTNGALTEAWVHMDHFREWGEWLIVAPADLTKLDHPDRPGEANRWRKATKGSPREPHFGPCPTCGKDRP